MIAGIISAIVSGIAIVASLMGTWMSSMAQSSDVQSTNDIIQQNNEANQELAQEEFNYTKDVNNVVWQREDNAVQRRAEDLKNAGINPMLAGLGGAQANGGQIYSGMPINNSLGFSNIGEIINQGFGGLANNLTTSGTNAAKIAQENYNAEENRKLQKDIQKNEIDTKLEMQRRDIMNSNLRDDKKYKAERSIENLKFINQLIEDGINANNEAIQKEADRKLQWNIATHKALRSMFENSEVPMLDNIWKALFDSLSEEEYEMIRNGKFSEAIAKKIKDTWNNIWKKDETIKTTKGHGGKGGGLVKLDKNGRPITIKKQIKK